jgi:hypothetical protein
MLFIPPMQSMLSSINSDTPFGVILSYFLTNEPYWTLLMFTTSPGLGMLTITEGKEGLLQLSTASPKLEGSWVSRVKTWYQDSEKTLTSCLLGW